MMKVPRKQWIKFGITTFLYILFIIWLRSWLGVIVIPFIFDLYITKKIKWTWWKQSIDKTVRTVMSWVDAIVFALPYISSTCTSSRTTRFPHHHLRNPCWWATSFSSAR